MKKFLFAAFLGFAVLTAGAAANSSSQAASQKCVVSQDEKEIRALFSEMLRLGSELNLEEMLKLYSPEYISVDENGETSTLAEIRNFAHHINEMLNSLNLIKNPNTRLEGARKLFTAMTYPDIAKECGFSKTEVEQAKVLLDLFSPDMTLSKFLTLLEKTFGGKTMSDAEFAEIVKKDNTPESKALLETMRQEILNEMVKNIPSISDMKAMAKKDAESFSLKSIKINGNQATAVYHGINPDTQKIEETTAILVKRNGKWLILKETDKVIEKK